MARMPIANSKSIMIEGRLRTAMGHALKSADLHAQQPKAPLIMAFIELSARSSALITIVNRPLWQYNPPASKLAQAEYSRRLRARKYSQNEARNWAKRVENERRESLRRSASETAKRWGGGITCTNVAPLP